MLLKSNWNLSQNVWRERVKQAEYICIHIYWRIYQNIQTFHGICHIYIFWREKVKQVEEYMAYRKLPRDTRNKITEYNSTVAPSIRLWYNYFLAGISSTDTKENSLTKSWSSGNCRKSCGRTWSTIIVAPWWRLCLSSQTPTPPLYLKWWPNCSMKFSSQVSSRSFGDVKNYLTDFFR